MSEIYQDPITLERIKLLHPKIRKKAAEMYLEICAAVNGRVICRFSYTLRSFAEQEKLYLQGRKTKGPIVTDAGPGKSYHNYGLAVDIVLLIDRNGDGKYEEISYQLTEDYDGDGAAEWKEITDIFLKYGWNFLTKNGKRYDFPHFQKTMGLSINDLLSL
jgi:peptidoglycan L-alanyl-D-glutamate endopeptidase CwlK